MQLTSIARPYANAAFEFAVTQKCVDNWYQQLSLLASIIEHKKIEQLLKNPIIDQNDILIELIDILDENLDIHLQNFLFLLVENQRLHLLPEITSYFYQARGNKEKFMNVYVETTYPLNRVQEKQLKKALELRFKRKIYLETKENQKLLGGAIIRANHLVFDGSGKTKLDQLKKWLIT